MIGCLWTCVRKQPIIAHYFEFENKLKFYNLNARKYHAHTLLINPQNREEDPRNTSTHYSMQAIYSKAINITSTATYWQQNKDQAK